MVASLILLSGLVVGTACFGMAEFAKMAFAMRARAKGKYGFEGCKNKAKCGFNGFYLASYSPEGLCDDCEFKQFPKRYVACLFCRMPSSKISAQSKSFSCLMCSSTVEEMLVGKLKKSDDWRQRDALKQGAFRALSGSGDTIGRKCIPALLDLETRSKVFKDYGPHIYWGAVKKENGNRLHVWVRDIDIAEEDKKETTWENCGDYVGSICKKYNIFGPETGAALLEKISENVSATYEEEEY